MLNKRMRSQRAHKATANDLYGVIVAHARRRAFYADDGVPDSVAGRFEMVVLHMVVFLERLEGGSDDERRLGQLVFEIFCDDMSATLREFGVNDAVMGKRMKKVAQSYFGRSRAYREAFAADRPVDLVAAVNRNLFPADDAAINGTLVPRVVALRARLGGIPKGAIAADPTVVAAEAGPVS